MLAAVLLAACGGDDGDAVTTTSSATTASTTQDAADFDWDDPTGVDIGGGFGLGPVEGNAPLVVVVRDGSPIGTLEVLRFGDDVDLAEHAESFVLSFAEDRTLGCGPGYTVVPEPTAPVGDDGLRYGFRATDAEGRPAELVVHWARRAGGELVIVAANANGPGSCVPPEGRQLKVHELDALVPLLDAFVDEAGLPD